MPVEGAGCPGPSRTRRTAASVVWQQSLACGDRGAVATGAQRPQERTTAHRQARGCYDHNRGQGSLQRNWEAGRDFVAVLGVDPIALDVQIVLATTHSVHLFPCPKAQRVQCQLKLWRRTHKHGAHVFHLALHAARPELGACSRTAQRCGAVSCQHGTPSARAGTGCTEVQGAQRYSAQRYSAHTCAQASQAGQAARAVLGAVHEWRA
jgi:hypothetical protein